MCLVFYFLGSIHLITNCETGEERKMRCCMLFPDIFTFSILFFNTTPVQVQRRNVSFTCEARRWERKKGSKNKVIYWIQKKFPTSTDSDPVNVDTALGDTTYFTSSTIFTYRVLSRNKNSYISARCYRVRTRSFSMLGFLYVNTTTCGHREICACSHISITMLAIFIYQDFRQNSFLSVFIT